jgi:hypothetical protein
MTKLFSAFIVIVLTGCAGSMKLTLMPRDSGKVYSGQLDGDGMGSGTAAIDIDGVICSGLAARVSSSEVTGISSTIGAVGGRNFSSSTIGVAGTGATAVKVLLSCNDGTGLRCELSGQNRRGGGVCIDDKGKAYDVLATPG